MKTRLLLGALIAFALSLSGCAAPVTCGKNTRLDVKTNQCVPDVAPGLNIIVDDFSIGQFRMTEVDVPEQIVVGTPQTRTFTITNTGTDDRPVVLVRYGLSPVKESIEELRNLIDEMTDGSELNATFLGMAVLKDLKAGETRQVEYYLSAPNTVQDDLYGFFFAVDEVPLRQVGESYELDFSVDGLGDAEGTGRLGNAALVYAPATVIVGNPDKPNLRVLFARSNNAAFELDPSERGAAELFTVSARMSSQARDLTEPVTASFSLKLPGHVPATPGRDLGPAWFTAKGLDYASAPATTVWAYDANRVFPLRIQQTEGQVASKQYGPECRLEYVVPDGGVGEAAADGGEELAPQVERCAYIFNEEGLDDVYPLHLAPEDIQLLGLTRSLPSFNPGLDADGELVGEVIYQLATPQAEYQGNVADNALAIPVVFMAPEVARAAAADDKDDNGLQVTKNDLTAGPYPYILKENLTTSGFGNDWFGAGYRLEDSSSVAKRHDVVTANYRKAEAALTATLLRADVDLIALSGNVDWNRSTTVQTWKAAAELVVLNYTVLDAAFDPNFCAVTDGIAYCPLFEAEPGADPGEESEKTSSGTDKEPDKKGRNLNKEWEWKFLAGPVPILITAEVGFKMGIIYSGKFLVDNRTPVTKFGVEFTVGPYAKVYASVFGGVSIGIARAGVEGNLTIVQLTFAPKLRPMGRQAFDSANDCWKYAETSLLFEGPLTLAGPSGDVSIVAYVGFKACLFGHCWKWEVKVFGLTIAKFETLSKEWMLWSKEWNWGRKPGDPGLCAVSYSPPATVVWQSPTSCSGKYCNGSFTRAATRSPANVLAGYKTTYELLGTAASCADVTVKGTTEQANDLVVIYDANNVVQNPVTFGTGASAVKVPGWSGAIDKTLRVCSDRVTVALETSESNTRDGVTVTFTPVQ